MKAEWRIWRYALPLTATAILAPGVAMKIREGLLLELVGEDGRSFWGEAAPLPGFSRESLDDARSFLEGTVDKLSKSGNSERAFADVAASLSSGSPSVGFAVFSVVEEPRIESDASVAVCGLLSGGRDEILADAAMMRNVGYEAAKLKVGRRDVADDAALVVEVRDALGESVALRLDANRAWSFDEAEEFARRIEGAGIEFIEEPLGDAVRLRELSEESGLPVALDESLAEMGPDEADGHGYARAFVLKPTVIGPFRTRLFASVANNIGAKCIISSSYESGVGTMGLLRLAASIGGGAAGLDTHRRLADDVLSPPLELSRPRVDMREVFGAARKVDYGKLERVL